MERVAVLHVDGSRRRELCALVGAAGRVPLDLDSAEALHAAASEGPVALLLVGEKVLAAEGVDALREAAAGQRPEARVPVVLVLEGGEASRVAIAERPDELIREPVDAVELLVRLESGLARGRGAELVAVASHELRSPIQGITTYLDALARMVLTGEQREMVVGAQAASRHLADLVEDLLEHARLGQGSVELADEPFAIREVLAEAVRIALDAAAPGHVGVAVRVEQSVPERLRGDGPRLRQLVINLLSNALKFACSADVTLEARAIEGLLELEVRDDGPGVPHARRSSVFEPFHRSAEPRRGGGTGLGLAIARTLARGMGGDVRIVDAPSGAAFLASVRLAAEGTSLDRDARPLALVADGDAIHRALVTSMVDRLGFRAEEVGEGVGAVLFALEHRPALVLVDLGLERVSGAEVAQRLRAAHVAVPIIAFSGSMGESAVSEALAAGVNAVLPKPVAPLQLQRALRRAAVEEDSPRLRPPSDDEPSGARVKLDAGRAMRSALRGMLDAVHLQSVALAGALADGDLGLVAEVSRTLRGAVIALNARGLEATLRDLEQSARAGDREECRRAHEAWARALESLRGDVERFLARAAAAR